VSSERGRFRGGCDAPVEGRGRVEVDGEGDREAYEGEGEAESDVGLINEDIML
jgi:hypothetical protein